MPTYSEKKNYYVPTYDLAALQSVIIHSSIYFIIIVIIKYFFFLMCSTVVVFDSYTCVLCLLFHSFESMETIFSLEHKRLNPSRIYRICCHTYHSLGYAICFEMLSLCLGGFGGCMLTGVSVSAKTSSPRGRAHAQRFGARTARGGSSGHSHFG